VAQRVAALGGEVDETGHGTTLPYGPWLRRARESARALGLPEPWPGPGRIARDRTDVLLG
jgi:hypothetical protein